MTVSTALLDRLREVLDGARLPLPLRSDGMAKVWGRSPKHGDSHVLDIRGWGELTGKGHGALGLPQAAATAIQDARAELFALLGNNAEALIAAAEAQPKPPLPSVVQLRHRIAEADWAVAGYDTYRQIAADAIDALAAEAGAWRPTREEIARTLDVRAFETVEEIGAGIHPRYGFSEKSTREYAASEQARREPRRVKALETADAILALPAPPTAEAK